MRVSQGVASGATRTLRRPNLIPRSLVWGWEGGGCGQYLQPSIVECEE